MITTYETKAAGLPCSCYVTKAGNIMPELCGRDADNTTTPAEICEMIEAKGWNACFSVRSKREFAERVNAENLVIIKNIVSESGDYEDADAASLAELRGMSEDELKDFLTVKE